MNNNFHRRINAHSNMSTMTPQTSFNQTGKHSPSPGLWQRAWDSLDDEVKAGVSLRANSRSIADAILHTANEKTDLCLRKRWKFRKSSGEEIIVRDVLEKVISWANKFKAVGDVATQYDPIHSSLPWAAVRFILQVSVAGLCP